MLVALGPGMVKIEFWEGRFLPPFSVFFQTVFPSRDGTTQERTEVSKFSEIPGWKSRGVGGIILSDGRRSRQATSRELESMEEIETAERNLLSTPACQR
jgi:hypothetical protein